SRDWSSDVCSSDLTQASLLNNLAKIHQGAGEPALAVPMLERASGIFKSQLGKRSADYATSLHNLGVAIWQNGSADAGYKYLKTAADIRRRVLGKNHPRYAETMLKLAEYQWHKKSIRNARESFG